MNSAKFTVFMMFAISISRGHRPMYELLKTEVESFSRRIDGAFSEFADLVANLHNKMENINLNVNSTVVKVNETMGDLEERLLMSLADSRKSIHNVGNYTHVQLGEMEGHIESMQRDAKDLSSRLERTQGAASTMLTALGEIKDDYEDFKRKTRSLWTFQSNMSDLSRTLGQHTVDVLRGLNDTKRQLKTAFRKNLQPLRKSMETLNDAVDVLTRKVQLLDTHSCSAPWSKFEDRCYLFVSNLESWKMAKFMCRQFDSHLVELYSSLEVNFVVDMLDNRTASLWTGASIGKKGVWYWTASKTEVNFDLFNGGYLHGRAREYCAVLVPGTLAVDDVNCGKKHPFVCKKFSLPGTE